MSSLIFETRQAFFQSVASQIGPKPGKLIVLTHVLPDRPELLDAFNLVAPISLVVAIPYSIHLSTLGRIKAKYNVATPSLEQLFDLSYLRSMLDSYLQGGKTVITEIGGYFAPFLSQLKSSWQERIAGFVEDTESGHRRYEAARPLPYPVYSVARSSLKEAEDSLVGPSCTFSVDKLLRSAGILLHSRKALVLGYGKIGRGTAHALKDKRCFVTVYDANPIRNAAAIGEGFPIPRRESALRSADIIFGATGATSIKREDFPRLKDGAILASCSSKDVEFDLTGLAQDYSKNTIIDNLDAWARPEQTIYLLARGTPVNFIDAAVIGPALSLVQAEIIVAIGEIFSAEASGEISEVGSHLKRSLADTWYKFFCNPETGAYRP